jgi:7-cyano-7-deazaguanine synthase in queuosine biosynthesis
MKAYEFLCGGSQAAPADPDTVRKTMDVLGERSVNLRISDISRAMVGNIPPLLLDLLEIAAYVYCGDQRARRGSEKLTRAGEDWTRDMHFLIPVRCLHIWSEAELRNELEETLGFLSDDRYSFQFVEANEPLAEPQLYFDELSEGTFEPDEIALFSGGIDSFAGAVESIAVSGNKTVLVGHHSANKVLAVQKELVGVLRKAGYGSRFMHVPVNVTNTHVRPAETTQRSRSFLFASLAFVLAQMFGKDGFTFYENGVVSLNIPIARDVLGARATRTTHPKVIRGFERVFSKLTGRHVRISTPYLWLTRKEVIERIVQAGFGDHLGKTASCVHPMLWTTEVHHCGRCSQCIDRRFAMLAAGAGACDPAEGYAVDLLTGARDNVVDIRLAVAYTKFCREIAQSGRSRFIAEHPDVYSAVGHVPGMVPDDVLDRVWDLLQRHAAAVNDVIADGLQAHADRLTLDTLPHGALLHLCFSRDRIEAPGLDVGYHEVAVKLDHLNAPLCEFAVDEENKQIWFRGEFCLDGGNFALLAALLPNHRSAKARCEAVPFRRAWELAEALNIDEPKLRKRISRLRQEVEEHLAVNLGVTLLGGFIENQNKQGYRIAPQAREVLRADLAGAEASLSQGQ